MAHVVVAENTPLAQYTSFGIGGPAQMFVEATSIEALSNTLAASKKLNLDTLILGGGTNLLISDQGFEGLVIRLDLDHLEIDLDTHLIRVGAGVPTAHVVEKLIKAGVGGLEFAAGLPGTIGGAIAGNAGCFGHTLSEFLKSATVVGPGGRVTKIDDLEWFDFKYRHTKLPSIGIALAEIVFALGPDDPEKLQHQGDTCIALRRDKHPSKEIQTAGSYFKNLPPPALGERRQAAGALLDQVGARSLSVGDAAVFDRHANIVINKGSATALDVLTLTAEMARRVRDRFDVALKEEVRFVGKMPKGQELG